PRGLAFASTQACIAWMRASRLMKSICKARMPKSRLRSADGREGVGSGMAGILRGGWPFECISRRNPGPEKATGTNQARRMPVSRPCCVAAKRPVEGPETGERGRGDGRERSLVKWRANDVEAVFPGRLLPALFFLAVLFPAPPLERPLFFLPVASGGSGPA